MRDGAVLPPGPAWNRYYVSLGSPAAEPTHPSVGGDAAAGGPLSIL